MIAEILFIIFLVLAVLLGGGGIMYTQSRTGFWGGAFTLLCIAVACLGYSVYSVR